MHVIQMARSSSVFELLRRGIPDPRRPLVNETKLPVASNEQGLANVEALPARSISPHYMKHWGLRRPQGRGLSLPMSREQLLGCSNAKPVRASASRRLRKPGEPRSKAPSGSSFAARSLSAFVQDGDVVEIRIERRRGRDAQRAHPKPTVT